MSAGDPIGLPLSDFSARAAWDRGHWPDNRTARLLGFVVQEGEDTYVARLAITCCAADAFPVKIKLLGKERLVAKQLVIGVVRLCGWWGSGGRRR